MIYHTHELQANPRRSVPQTRAKPAGAAPSPAACAPRVAGSAAAGDSHPCKCAYQRAANPLHTHSKQSLRQSRLCPKPGRAPLATRSNAKQPMEGRRPRAILPSGRVSLTLIGYFPEKMPADIMEKNSSSPVAATPASMNTTPDKPKTASEHRKSSKPIMEKRRRARINESLGQLKTLILDALKKDSSRHSKLEKADILEMTVKHLRNMQRAQMTAALNTDPTVLGKYRAGFSECMNEVTRFLSTCEGVNTEVRTRLLGHLASCMTQINAMNYPTQHQIPAGPPHPSFSQPMVQIPSATQQANVVPLSGVPCKSGSSSNLTSDATKVYGGFQLVPATDGQFAFLIPNAAFAPNGPVIPVYANNSSTPVPVAVSPGAPSVTSDSVWRPW
ncbi:Transcription factor HES-1-B [Labeo rohita]|uniref:Transcription factor HES-1-B n=6 Tax=Cyprinidae TaxID=7953 RepID=A0ABQ8MLC3_LABRO|nr:Transcription factor HES-1-B [Labeo rohita]